MLHEAVRRNVNLIAVGLVGIVALWALLRVA
jgi:hypothetical protein